MNKKALIVISIAALALIVLTSLYLLRPSSKNSTAINSDQSAGASQNSSMSTQTADSPQADALLATFGTIGQPYTLHSRSYQQGQARTEDTADLGWNGDMTLWVNSAQVLEYNPADVDSEFLETWNNYLEGNLISNPCVLKLEITLKNENAENSSGVRYQFRADMFRLAAYADLIPENWQNPETYISVGQQYSAYENIFDKHGAGKDYYSFSLEPGQQMDFTMEYLIDRDYLNQKSPFLAVGSSKEIKCGVLLNDLK